MPPSGSIDAYRWVGYPRGADRDPGLTLAYLARSDHARARGHPRGAPGRGRRRGGHLHPAAVRRRSVLVRPRARESRGVRLPRRRRRDRVHHPVGLQAVRARPRRRRHRRRRARATRAGRAERRGVQRDQPRAGHGAPGQLDGQRGGDHDVVARPRGDGGRALRAHPPLSVGLRRARARRRRRRARVRARDGRSQPRPRLPDAQCRIAPGRRGRDPRRVLRPVLAARHDGRSRHDGGDARQRRRQPDHRRDA